MSRMNFSNEHTTAVFADESKCSFAAFTELMNDVGGKKEIFDAEGNTVSKVEANDQIRNIMFNVLGIEASSDRKTIRRAIRKHKTDVFEVVEDTLQNMLQSGWGANPFFQQFVETKNINDGDENIFYAPTQMILTVSQVSGNHHNLLRQRLTEGAEYSIKTNWYGIKIYAEYEQFMAGRIDWAMFIQKVYEAFDKKVNSMVYSSVTSVGISLPAGSQWQVSSPLSTTTKDQFMQLVEDVQTANGTDVVIMGTRAALSNLTKLALVDWISNEMKQERNTTGRLGTFEGITLFEIPQAFADNDTTTRLVDNTKLLIMPNVNDNKFIKLINEGDSMVNEVSDGTTNVDKTLEYEYQAKMGVGVVISRLFGIWTITA